MIKIKNGVCEIVGPLAEISDDFRILLHAIECSRNNELLDSLIDVISKELEEIND